MYDFEVVYYVVGSVQEEARHHAVELAGHVGAAVYLGAPTPPPFMPSAKQLLLPSGRSSWHLADTGLIPSSRRRAERPSPTVALQDAAFALWWVPAASRTVRRTLRITALQTRASCPAQMRFDATQLTR